MELSEIIPHIEALIFASERPLTSLEIVDLINNAFGFMEQQISLDQVESALDGIREKYNADFYPFEVLQSGGGWQFLSKPSFHTTIAQLNGGKFLKKLSNAALETLSIIAYKQPITKGEIESIRGVNSDYSVQKLLEKELIIISGRSEELPGKPLIYETSKSFMDYFGLNSADDLPKIREVLAEQMVEPTSQERNVEKDADFGIFKKENEVAAAAHAQPSIEIIADEEAPVQAFETAPADADGIPGAMDLSEAGEEEIADEELRESIADEQEEMQTAFQADMTGLRSDSGKGNPDAEQDEASLQPEETTRAAAAAAEEEEEEEEEELADELKHEEEDEDDEVEHEDKDEEEDDDDDDDDDEDDEEDDDEDEDTDGKSNNNSSNY